MKILTPAEAFKNSYAPLLGASGNTTKVGYREFVSFVELAPIIGHPDLAIWVNYDASCDNIDFMSADDAAQAVADGYQSGE